jgi:hypothetical protein
MLFRFRRDKDALQRALRAAVAAHRCDVLRDLLARQDEIRFAGALSGLSARVIADAISMLSADERIRVARRLPAALRRLPGMPAGGASA